MRFQAKTEEEIMSSGTLEGVFDFDIRSAREYVSDKGNDIFEIELNVYDTEGAARPRKDWVTPAFPKKFKHLHDACGMLDKYQAGATSAEDFVGKAGKLKMVLRKYTNKDGNEVTGDQVEDYIKRENLVKAPVAEPLSDDEVPF